MSNSPFAGAKLYVDPNSQAMQWVNNNRHSRPGDAELIFSKIANQPQAFWLGEWSGDVGGTVRETVSQAQSNGALPVLVSYYIPNRDVGQFSSGGAATGAYLSWINSLASGLGGSTIPVVLEPDSLIHMDNLRVSDQEIRYNLLKSALSSFPNSQSTCYLDGGHMAAKSADIMAERLAKANVSAARGFALNVSNFRHTEECIAYGNQINSVLQSRFGISNKHFIIDVSRNGLGPIGTEWCNPRGRALGQIPTSTGMGAVDALIWIKRPGESDGKCNGGPSAGQFWVEYAIELASNANW